MAVVGLDRSPLGQLLYEPDRQQALAALRRSGRLDGLSDDAVQQALVCLARDEQLRSVSGRWVPGRPDPETFVPGDVAPVRVGAGKPILISGWRLIETVRDARCAGYVGDQTIGRPSPPFQGCPVSLPCCPRSSLPVEVLAWLAGHLA